LDVNRLIIFITSTTFSTATVKQGKLYIQYGAREKSLSGVVGKPTPGESLRVQLASQA